jgi:uncharacterized glyoxalase superfamily protein PhnB
MLTLGGQHAHASRTQKMTTMILKRLTPNLMVKDVNRTIAFYRELLRFELNQTVPETGPFEWASLKCGEVEIMFQAESSLAHDIPALKGMDIGGSLTFYIQMAGIEELYDRVKDSVTIVQDMHTTFYGMREFTLRDCNGYLLAFAESA